MDDSDNNRESNLAFAITFTESSLSSMKASTSDTADRPRKRQKKVTDDISTDACRLYGQKISNQGKARERWKSKETVHDRGTGGEPTTSAIDHQLTVREAYIAAMVAASSRNYEC